MINENITFIDEVITILLLITSGVVFAACESLKKHYLSCHLFSDLLRSRQNAEPGLNVVLEPRLREIHLGEWEGMLYDEIASRFSKELAERDPVHFSAPGGELPAEV